MLYDNLDSVKAIILSESPCILIFEHCGLLAIELTITLIRLLDTFHHQFLSQFITDGLVHHRLIRVTTT